MKAQIIKKVSLVALLGFAAFAANATEWTYYAKGAENSPASDYPCITDGNWVLQVNKLDASTGTITLGAGGYNVCIKAGSGILDLRGTVVTVNGIAYDKKIINSELGYQYNKGEITEFYADGVGSFGARAFQTCKALTTVSITGTFTTIGANSFSGCSTLTKVVLNSTALATIGALAFQEAKNLSAIEITSDRALTVNSTAMQFTYGPLTSLTINTPVWETTNVDNLLSGNAASDTTKKCTIYANKDIWSSLAAKLTEAEEAVKPKKCFGVYREDSRKAWLVSNNSAPVPFRIIIR